jgi:hypothetical protein
MVGGLHTLLRKGTRKPLGIASSGARRGPCGENMGISVKCKV